MSQPAEPRAYREEWEPVDHRPLVVRRFPFWTVPLEKAVTEEVVRQNPILPGEAPGAYLARISPIVARERAPILEAESRRLKGALARERDELAAERAKAVERAGAPRRPSDEFLIPPGQPLFVAPQGEAPAAREPGEEG